MRFFILIQVVLLDFVPVILISIMKTKRLHSAFFIACISLSLWFTFGVAWCIRTSVAENHVNRGQPVLFSKTTNITELNNQTGALVSITVTQLSLLRTSGTKPSILITGSFVLSSLITFEQGEGSVWRSASMSAVVHAPVCKLWGQTDRQTDRVS